MPWSNVDCRTRGFFFLITVLPITEITTIIPNLQLIMKQLIKNNNYTDVSFNVTSNMRLLSTFLSCVLPTARDRELIL